MEMSCPWVSNRQKKTSEKTMKDAPRRWELKQKYPGYEISQYNIIVDVLGGWSTNVEVSGEGASWEASQKHPQEDAEGMPIRHTEHCTYF